MSEGAKMETVRINMFQGKPVTPGVVIESEGARQLVLLPDESFMPPPRERSPNTEFVFVVEVDTENAGIAKLLRDGVIVPAGSTPPDTVTSIANAIGGLDTGDPDLWTAQGKPQVAALEEYLGYDITAAQRDQAYDIFRARRG